MANENEYAAISLRAAVRTLRQLQREAFALLPVVLLCKAALPIVHPRCNSLQLLHINLPQDILFASSK